jgi:ABC-type transport system substrate-binding protein
MSRRAAVGAALCAVLVLLAACTRDEPGPRPPREGGTLRVGLVADLPGGLDPQKAAYPVTWELFRCCLLRTLLSYPGLPAARGGSELRPDLAVREPDVSEDGLVWTFRLRPDLRYGPPLEDTPIVAEDVIRALERAASPNSGAGGYGFLYRGIEGFEEFAAGETSSIEGLQATNARTLEVRLTEPAGDLGYLMSLPATAPIPAEAAAGHVRDYGAYLVSSGPYMVAGSPRLDFDRPPEEQRPLAGWRPGRRLTLVPNPSWDGESDDLRRALAGRIEVRIGGDPITRAEQIEAGTLDLMMDAQAPAATIREYQASPELSERVLVHQTMAFQYVAMNLALPPFDDVAVRRAVNLAVDKQDLRRIGGGPGVSVLMRHTFPNAVLGNRLAGYDPYRTPGSTGDVDAARRAMSGSRYDRDRDGTCDGRVCKRVPIVVTSLGRETAESIADDLRAIGIDLEVRTVSAESPYEPLTSHDPPFGLSIPPTWRSDYPDAGTIAGPLLSRRSIGPDSCCNVSLVGATRESLRELGYEDAEEVAGVDERIRRCDVLAGEDRLECWVRLDRVVMERVVPWVPVLVFRRVDLVSERVTGFSFDQFTGLPALDRVAVR